MLDRKIFLDICSAMFLLKQKANGNNIHISTGLSLLVSLIMKLSIVTLLSTLGAASVNAFSLSSKPVSQLLQDHSATIASLKEQASKSVDITQEPYANDVFFLRYALLEEEESPSDRLASTLAWRTTGTGAAICDAAQAAVKAATSADGSWNNAPVLEAAPHSDTIGTYLTPENLVTTSTAKGDLLCCIRAGGIDDVAMMKAVSVDEMVEFFIYSKEVNHAVANSRSIASDVLHCILLANDLGGVKLIGGEAKFRSALSESSKTTNPLYPTLSGPTLLLNLPKLLGALVKLFTPLFPPAVREKIRFEQGPLSNVDDLMNIVPGGKQREEFLTQMTELVYQD